MRKITFFMTAHTRNAPPLRHAPEEDGSFPVCSGRASAPEHGGLLFRHRSGRTRKNLPFPYGRQAVMQGRGKEADLAAPRPAGKKACRNREFPLACRFLCRLCRVERKTPAFYAFPRVRYQEFPKNDVLRGKPPLRPMFFLHRGRKDCSINVHTFHELQIPYKRISVVFAETSIVEP